MLIVKFADDFPLRNVRKIGERLQKSGILVPGYRPAEVGMLALEAIKYAQEVEGKEFRILTDRNLISRIASITRDGARHPLASTWNHAADLMAFAQAMNLLIDPTIAFYELAHRNGNYEAWNELNWFRVGDKANATAWINIANGRRKRVPRVENRPGVMQDLTHPLTYWQKNYIISLKIAELALSNSSQIEGAQRILDWMSNEFFIGGPAAMFAIMYFSPKARKKGLMKNLRSSERERAISGIQNAARDLTYLSYFLILMEKSELLNQYIILATADLSLNSIASAVLLGDEEAAFATQCARRISDWWPEYEARIISQRLGEIYERGRPTASQEKSARLRDRYPAMIAESEAALRAWIP